MMRQIIILVFIIILFLFPQGSLAQDNDADLLAQATEAYFKNDLGKTLKLYLKLKDNRQYNGHIDYNIANTYYRLGEVGEAIQFYEKARRLLPRDPDIRANLKFVEKKRVDQISPSMISQFESIFFFWTDYLTLNELILFLLFDWIVFWGLFGVSFIAKKWFLKRVVAGWLGVLFLLALSVFVKYTNETSQTLGVILRPEVFVRPTYLESVEGLFKLHEGTVVEITGRQEFGKEDSWVQLRLPNGVQGWIPQKMAGII